MAAHYVYDIGAGQKLLNEGLRYRHGAILTCYAAADAAFKKPARSGLFKTQRVKLLCWCIFHWFFAFLWFGSCVNHGVLLWAEGVKIVVWKTVVNYCYATELLHGLAILD